jgi:glycosyltransferase involved in cell wall biosynthesis
LIIAFDTFFLAGHFRNVGIYEYAKHLLNEFHAVAAQNNSISIRYFVSPGYFDESVTVKSTEGCTPAHTRLLEHDGFWRLGVASVAARQLGADVLFTPSPNILPLGVIPVAVTIHDVMPERLPPELVERRARLRAATWLAAKFSQKVITDSEHSKKDLIDLYDLPHDKVSVVYLGYDRGTFNSSAPDPAAQKSLLTKLGISTPYIIHHGMVQSRKNVGRLVKAYELLLEKRRNLDTQLVLAGPFGLGSEQIRKDSDDLVRTGKVVFTGALDAGDLAMLVKGAMLCVIPSLYEGFCLPMVEAMACGVPTVVSNTTCLPEVSGGVLRYFDPLSEEDMAATMENVLEHSELRKELAIQGLRRASEFSWRRCAQETVNVLADMKASGAISVTDPSRSAQQAEVVNGR